ncbi:MAG: CBS domain-containing protein, partial [Paraburkholderia terricola]
HGHHHIPVLDAERRLVGMVTPSDVIAGLHRHAQRSPRRAA